MTPSIETKPRPVYPLPQQPQRLDPDTLQGANGARQGHNAVLVRCLQGLRSLGNLLAAVLGARGPQCRLCGMDMRSLSDQVAYQNPWLMEGACRWQCPRCDHGSEAPSIHIMERTL